MKNLKVMTILGTRPEIIRLSRVLAKLEKFTKHVLVHTGQNYDYELNEIFFNDLEIKKPNYFLNSAKSSGAQTIGQIIINIDEVLEKENPDAVLVLGDTNSCLSVIAAKRRKIPIFHMEAGNRCFDLRVPEEINRKIIDHISDVNITYSSIARDYLIQEGIKPDLIIKSGSPMKEVLDYYKEKILKSKILNKLNLEKNEYYLVSIHREENVDCEENLTKINKILNKLSQTYKLPVIFSTHPRTKERIKNLKFDKNIKFIKPLSFTEYNSLQINSKVVISDSGTISEESSILNFNAINLRETHERPEAMEEASIILSGLNEERFFQALDIVISNKQENSQRLKLVQDYNVDNVSEKILRIIISYTDYINNFTWKK